LLVESKLRLDKFKN